MLRFFILVLLAIACGANQSARADDEIFPAQPTAGLTAKWRDVQARMSEDAALLEACLADPRQCSREATQLADLLAAGNGKQGRARVGHINRAINLAIRPISDADRFGADHWSTPIETLNSGGGDCEDYAILKFLVLREAGIAEADLKLLIVRQPANATDHAVLAARVDGEWLLLDSQGFALVRLQDSRYRVLAEFASETAFATASKPDLPPLL